jgi:PsbP
MKNSLILLCCLCTASLLHAQTGTAVKTKWLTHYDSSYHFSFQYPEDWQLKLPGTNTRFFVTSYPENDSDNFRENINCIVRKMEDTGFKIKTAEADIKATLAEKMTDFKMLRSGYKKWNGKDALYMEYTCTNKSEDLVYYIHIYQQVAIWRGILYTMTYTSESKSYSKYWNTISTIMQSLKAAP